MEVARLCAMDIAIDSRLDLTDSRAVSVIIGWIRSGGVAGVFLGTPCNSRSRARRGPPTGGCPPALRDLEHIWGFGKFEGAHLRALQLGNSTSVQSCRIISA
jgi:hypothetical protein